MNRNSENHFASNPTNIDMQRSRFNRSSQHKTTFNTGDLIPIYVDEIIPGDTVTMDMAHIIRMSTPIHPVMDNAFVDTYFFFVPNRLVWQHWKEFNGENTTSHWAQETIYEIPQIKAPTGGWTKGTIADYMGIPTGKVVSINHLPFRAYALIWNEWFRDQNLQDPCNIKLDDGSITGSNSEESHVIGGQLGAQPNKVNKFHDYFTSALPEPQKGPAVLLPLGNDVPVYAANQNHQKYERSLIWGNTEGAPFSLTPNTIGISLNSPAPADSGRGITKLYTTQVTGGLIGPLAPTNLYADMSNATSATINELRQAFQIQKLFERDARGGTRYTEIIKSHFGVTSPDARQQRPEYLGGHRNPINMDQVIQTSETGNNSPQGNTAAYSLTGVQKSMFTKSFTEHGYIIGLAAIRTDHTYQQGIEKMWSRKRRFDFYWPALANIGEQAILNKELYAQGLVQESKDEEAFGYQEAWAEYRYKPSRVSGEMRSEYAQSLDVWHYADHYESQPFLSEDWIQEPRENVNRTLATSDLLADQFIADFAFKAIFTRPMPIYSIPGLIDHH